MAGVFKQNDCFIWWAQLIDLQVLAVCGITGLLL
jgi:hypothetical protein